LEASSRYQKTQTKYGHNDLNSIIAPFDDSLLVCKYCSTKFTQKNNLYRHEKYFCHIKLDLEKKQNEIEINNKVEKAIRQIISEQKVSQLEKELEMVKKQLKTQKKENIKQLKNANNDKLYFQEIHKTSIATANNSVNALTYLTQNHKKTPELKKLTQEGVKKLLSYEKKLYEYLLFNSGEGKLANYIGDIILKHVVTDDPEDQPVWITDVARLTYLIRDLVNNKQKWKKDTNGVKITRYVIDPILSYIDEYMTEHLNKVRLKVPTTLGDQDEHMRIQGSILSVIRALKGKKFTKTILLHMAPYVAYKDNIEM